MKRLILLVVFLLVLGFFPTRASADDGPVEVKSPEEFCGKKVAYLKVAAGQSVAPPNCPKDKKAYTAWDSPAGMKYNFTFPVVGDGTLWYINNGSRRPEVTADNILVLPKDLCRPNSTKVQYVAVPAGVKLPAEGYPKKVYHLHNPVRGSSTEIITWEQVYALAGDKGATIYCLPEKAAKKAAVSATVAPQSTCDTLVLNVPYTTLGKLFVRTGTDLKSAVIATLRKSDTVTPTACEQTAMGPWFKVTLASGKTGYIASWRVKVIAS